MKLIEMFGLAALIVLATMAGNGAITSISQATTVLCSENVTPCPAEKVLPKGTPLAATLKVGTQKIIKQEKISQEVLPNVSCQGVEAEGKGTESDSTQILGEVTKLVPTSCTAGKLFNCSVEPLQLPYSNSSIYTSQGNGTYTVFAAGGSEQPGSRFKCPIVGLDCIFKVNETNSQNGMQAGNLTFTGGNPATIAVNQILLKTVTPNGGNCMTIKHTWMDLTFTVTKPNPAYLSKDQA